MLIFFIHGVATRSDIIAYPLASFRDESACFQLRDAFIDGDVNLLGTIARKAGQLELSVALEASDAHRNYWSCSRTVELVGQHLLG